MPKDSKYERAYAEHPSSDFIHVKRMEIMQEWVKAKTADPNNKISLLNYMETYYPDFKNGIELEKLRVEEQQIIYAEYLEAKNKGDLRDFKSYAAQEYGFYDPDDEKDICDALGTSKQL